MAIYLDHNAGSPLRCEVQAAIAQIAAEGAANPAAVHHSGQAARKRLETARAQVGELIGALPGKIVFTSGGTEANNLAIFGAAAALKSRRRIISTAIEHSSVLAPLASLESSGYEVRLVAPDSRGRIDPAQVIALLDRDTAILSLGLANAEIGTIADLDRIAPAAREVGAIFHVDAVQAVGKIAVDVDDIGCDLMSLSAHKLGAPAGIGALYVRDPATLVPQMLGGPQEHGLRAGTPNLLGAVGFGAAASVLRDTWLHEAERVERLAAILSAALTAAIPGLIANHPESGGLCNTLNFTFPAVSGETLLFALDLAGVEVSMGSACAAGAVEPSHVLMAMGRSRAAARSSLRISLGHSTTMADVEEAGAIIPRVWRRVATRESAAVAVER